MQQRGDTRTRENAEATLREMVAHLNVIDAGIARIGEATGTEMTGAARDVLSRLELLAFLAARVRIDDMPRVTDALEELVLAAQLQPVRPAEDISATLRHGIDVLLLLTHDAMRRMQGYPAAELRAAIDAVIERVDRLIGCYDAIERPALKVAGL
jgi:ethanolamine ammonia-lyase large subunit